MTLPGDPRLDHRPQRRPARRVGRRADDRRRPDHDRERRRARSPRSSQDRLGVDYIEPCRTGCASRTPSFQYIARRVPSTEAAAVVDEIDDAGYKGLDTRRDPVRTYPAKDVAANLVGFMNAEGEAGEGAELMFDTLLGGKDGSATYEVGGGNRIPLGDNSVTEPRGRPGPRR